MTTVSLEPHPDDERLAVLRLDRPPVNALDQPMWDRLDELAAELHASTAYRAVVITGGRHFAAGADVKALLELTAAEFDRRNRILQRAFHAIATAPQIVLAAIEGYALGGGCELALAADFRIAGLGAVLGLPEITLGIMPGSGGTQRLGRLVGHARAKDLVLTGRQVRAGEAREIGLVDEVVDDAYGEAVRRGLRFACGPAALWYAKRALGADLPIGAGLALEADLIAACFATEDARDGLRAFVDKREPNFRGR